MTVRGNGAGQGASWIDDNLVRELVTEAIDVGVEQTNMFLEVSILASRTKARLIAEKAPSEKVLFGSDFPIYKPVFGSVVFQENALLEAGAPQEAIRAFHNNATRLFGRSIMAASVVARA